MLFGKYVNKYYFKYAIFFLLGVIALIVVDFAQLEIPDIIGQIIDDLEAKTLTQETLKSLMIKMMFIALALFSGRFLWRVCIFGNGIKIESDVRNEMFLHMEKLSQKYYQENNVGALMALYTNDLNMIRQTFGMGTIMLVDALCLGTLALIKMFRLNILLSIVSLVFLVGITIFASIIGKKITHYTKVNFEVFGRLTNFVQETFSGIGVVKAFVLEKIQMLRFGKRDIDNMNSTLDITKASALMNTIINVILSLVNIIIIGYGGYVIYTNQNNLDITFTVGDLTKFISYFGSLIWPIEAVGRLIALRSQGQASLTRVSAVLDLKPAINDDLVEDESVMIEGKIEYRNLSFAYPTNPNIVLSDVSFTINKGEFVGIIGATGSGKTTLVDVLLRIYNIEEGSLFIDDVDIMKIPLKKVRDSIAYVPQDNFLFSDTIKKNIAFSSKEVDDEKVTSFSQIADIREDVLVFKDGFDTVLGERGVTVSGGQKQRISIARALYKDANILILDDSLSAVDTETEKNIITNLRDLRKGKTTIIIAHRITTLKDLDKIVVVENGCVTAVGKHEELVNCNSFYSNEVQLQKLEEEEK